MEFFFFSLLVSTICLFFFFCYCCSQINPKTFDFIHHHYFINLQLQSQLNCSNPLHLHHYVNSFRLLFIFGKVRDLAWFHSFDSFTNSYVILNCKFRFSSGSSCVASIKHLRGCRIDNCTNSIILSILNSENK